MNTSTVTVTMAIPLVVAIIGLVMFLLCRDAASGAGKDMRELGRIIFTVGFFWFVAVISNIRV